MEKTLRLLILSDTHRDLVKLNRVVAEEMPFDYLVHCGDAEVNLDAILDYRNAYQLLAVQGNCDQFSFLPELITLKLGYYNVTVVHGHKQDLHRGMQGLKELARRERSDVVLFGHTHSPLIWRDETTGVLYVNPGSLTRNRPYPRAGTYACLTLSSDELPQALLKELEI